MVYHSCALNFIGPDLVYPHPHLPLFLEVFFGPSSALLAPAHGQALLTESAFPTVVLTFSWILGGVVWASPLLTSASKILTAYLPHLAPASWL